MRKVFIGALVLLVLFLAGMNASLRSRQKELEERLAAAEQRKTPRKAAEPAPPAAEPEPARAELPAVAEKKPEAAAPAPAVKPVKASAEKTSAWTMQTGGKMVFTIGEPELGLSEAQKRVIDELKRNREELSKSHRELIDQIARDTDQAIRAVLTPEQLAKYENRATASVQIQADPAPAPVSGVKPGYLGINGGDAPGGGATVTGVMDNTVAQAAGLQPGDVILAFNGEPVDSLAALSAKIRSTGEGAVASLRIRRGGSEFQQPLQLGAWPR